LCNSRSIATFSPKGLIARGPGWDDSRELHQNLAQDIQVNLGVNKKNLELTGNYIAGLVQADGSFSAVLSRKTRKDKEYLNLSLVFTIVQNQKYKDLILDIQKKWGNIGHWHIINKDNSIRYQVTKQNDLLNVVIPFFMKHQLRSGKLLSFLKFKYIVETMASKAHIEDKNVFLSLVVIASNMNPLGKLGNKIRYLKPEQQHFVINNIQPEGVDISKLMESVKNFKSNDLNLDFIKGLFDGDGNLTAYIVSLKKDGLNYKLSMRFAFTIIQDVHSLSLLDEIKSYFGNTGFIYELSNNCSIYKVGSRSDLIDKVLPKIANKESIHLIKDRYEGLPLMKYNKIYSSCRILELLSEDSISEKTLYKIFELSYYISKDSDKITLNQYIENIKQKWVPPPLFFPPEEKVRGETDYIKREWFRKEVRI
jgi:hypothetical protein